MAETRPNLAHLIPADEVLREELAADPALRAEWERGHIARDVAHWLIGYRATHGLTQPQLACALRIDPAVVTHLESGDVLLPLDMVQTLIAEEEER